MLNLFLRTKIASPSFVGFAMTSLRGVPIAIGTTKQSIQHITLNTTLVQYKYSTFSLTNILKVVGIVLLIFLFSCKNKNPEQKEYDSMLSSLKYKSYKTLSENTIPPLILLYNTTGHADEPKISEDVLRLLLGYSWAVGGRPDYAIAESNIIMDISASNKDVKFLTHSLAAIALYEKGWKSLAIDESRKGKALLNKMPKSNELQLNAMAFHIITGTLCLYEENYQGARFHFAGFNITSKIEWPYLIVDAMADIKEGKVKQGLRKIKKISKSKSTPETIKKSLTETLIKTEKKSETVDAKLFWTKQTSLALYDEIKNSAVPGIVRVANLLENLSEKLKIE